MPASNAIRRLTMGHNQKSGHRLAAQLAVRARSVFGALHH
jgi:hypothetical protein